MCRLHRPILLHGERSLKRESAPFKNPSLDDEKRMPADYSLFFYLYIIQRDRTVVDDDGKSIPKSRSGIYIAIPSVSNGPLGRKQSSEREIAWKDLHPTTYLLIICNAVDDLAPLIISIDRLLP